jgi:hypothetical protein
MIGMATIELKELPLLLEHTIATMIREVRMVVDTEFFLIPKYSGISAIKVDVNAFIKTLIRLVSNNEVVSSPGMKSQKLLH